MEINVTVPSMGESITTAIISNWFVNDGDLVKKNDPIYELETDKITSEVTAEKSGIIKIKAEIDEEVDIGSIVAIIEEKEILESTDRVEKPTTEIKKPIEPEITKIEKVANDNSDKEDRKKMNPLRKKIAERLVTATQETALLTTFNEVDMLEVMTLRKKVQDEFIKKNQVKLGFMSFFTKAVVKALEEVPSVN